MAVFAFLPNFLLTTAAFFVSISKSYGQDDTCGFTSTAGELAQTLSSPNWPMSYPNNADCTWEITTDPGFRIRINFVSFVTEDCCDRVSITVEDGVVIHKQGEMTMSESLVSMSNRISLRFQSDEKVTFQGFRATFQKTSEPSRYGEFCGNNLVATNVDQLFHSPGWPHQYPDDFYCVWNITARPGYKIRVNFTYFETEYCCDFLEVTEGNEPLLRIRGNLTVVEPIISRGNQIAFHFFADSDEAFKGFRAFYRETLEEPHLQAPCGFSKEATSGFQNLLSPGYPGTYDNNANCEWQLATDEDSRIDLELKFIEVESCCDSLTVYDGYSVDGVKFGLDSESVRSYFSKTNHVRLQFTSDQQIFHLGFWITYRKVESQVTTTLPSTTSTTLESERICGFGRAATSTAAPITSPGWPNPYPVSINCEWTLQARNRYKLRLDFTVFSTEETYDFLSIRENGKEILKLHGNITEFPSPLVSKTNRLVLIFHSDGSGNDRGFQATYQETRDSSILPFAPCGFEAIATRRNQSLNSPGWPRSYDDHLNCMWNITARRKHRIKLYFISLDTETNSDFLQGLTDGMEVFRQSGQHFDLRIFVSTKNQMTLRFSSDRSVRGRGFQIKFHETLAVPIMPSTPCGSRNEASATMRILRSPRWPATYGNNLDCQWTITASFGWKIHLDILSFNTESCCDYLDIFDGEILKLRLAGDVSVNSPIVSHSHNIRLTFHSDSTIIGHGFQIGYRGMMDS